MEGKKEKQDRKEEKESQKKKTIKICFFNATGCKDKDSKFWDYIDKFDIVGIQETWVTREQMTKFNNSLRPSFKWKHQPATKESPSTPGTAKGGILTGVKCEIAENDVDIEEVDGIMERRPIIGKDEWRILTVYSRGMKETRKHLERMVRFTESRNVIIGGDFNARTKAEGTIIWGPVESEQPRKSEDVRICTDGRTLIKMVEENGWSIMNGNMGDKGEFTNITGNGSSVIDYVIANVKARDKVRNFNVDCEEFTKDHRPIIIEIEKQDQEEVCDQMEEERERKKLQQIRNEDQVWEYINAEKEARVRRVEKDFARDENEETAMEITVGEIGNQMAKLNIDKANDMNILKEIINVCKKTDIIPETQAEFKSANGAVDNVFILNSIIKTELKKRCQVYAFFVKLSEAFDTVDREELQRMLETNGISQTLRTEIRKIHRETEGLRRGCPLNPMLFSLYIADLEGEMREADIEDFQFGEIKLRSFVNKDNIVLIAQSSEGLKKLMGHLKSYLDRKKLKINFEKSKVLVFTKSLVENEQWKWGEEKIDEVDNYKYLKFHFVKKGTWNVHAKETVKRAMVAMAYTWHIGKRKFGDNIKERMMMFGVLIANILLDGAEIGDLMDMRIIEQVQEKYIRLILEEVIGERIENTGTEVRKIAKKYEDHMKRGHTNKIFKEYWKSVEEMKKKKKE